MKLSWHLIASNEKSYKVGPLLNLSNSDKRQKKNRSECKSHFVVAMFGLFLEIQWIPAISLES